MHVEIAPNQSAAGLRIAVALSRYHQSITDRLLEGARGAFVRAGGAEDDLFVVAVTGSFELPVVAASLADRADVDAVVALGCIVKGETSHDRCIADAVAQGLTRVAVERGKPVSFGVLTCDTIEQAAARAGGAKGNKGEEAMIAAIEARRAVDSVHALTARARAT